MKSKPNQDTILETKAALYIRVSTQYQVDKDSLKVQRRDLEAYCRLMLHTENYVVFEDPGFSAKNTDRPEYQKMMSQIRSGEFSHLIVWKLDRISRNLLDFSSMYEELKELGVTFISLNEQFDTSSAMGEAMLKIILVFAELERKMTAERVSAVMASRAQVGKWNGGRVPYGYNYDKETQTFTINRAEQAVFNRIWDLYEEKQSIIAVVHWLNDNGFRTKRGNDWTSAVVHKLLSNEWYTGVYIYSKEGKPRKNQDPNDLIITPDHHVAMVSQQRYDRMQLMLKRNGRGVEQRSYERKYTHIFAGILRCKKCDGNMVANLGRMNAAGWRPSNYGCTNRRKRSGCTNKYVTDKVVGPFVFNVIGNILKFQADNPDNPSISDLEAAILNGKAFERVKSIDPSGLDDLLTKIQSGASGLEYVPASIANENNAPSKVDALNARRRQLEIALKRLSSLYLYSEAAMDEESYVAQKQRILDEISEIDKTLSELRTEGSDFDLSDYHTLEQASYFILVQQLLHSHYVDYENIIRSIDPTIAKSFIRSVLSVVYVDDGRVTDMIFQNELSLTFLYD